MSSIKETIQIIVDVKIVYEEKKYRNEAIKSALSGVNFGITGTYDSYTEFKKAKLLKSK